MLWNTQPRRASTRSQRIPLRLILVVPFVFQVVTAVGVTGWLSLRNGQKAVHEVATELTSQLANDIEGDLRTYLATPHLIAGSNADAITLNQLNVRDLVGLQRHFIQQIQQYDRVAALVIGNEQKEMIAVERSEDGTLTIAKSDKSTGYDLHTYAINSRGESIKQLGISKNFDPRSQPWYKAAVKARSQTWSQISPHVATSSLMLTAVEPIYDAQGKLEGVLNTSLHLSQIGQFLRQKKTGKTGQSFIIERSGLLVATSTNEPLSRQRNHQWERVRAIDSSNPLTKATTNYLTYHFGNLTQIKAPQPLNFVINGKPQFLHIMPLSDGKGLDWLIVVVIPQADFMEHINANTQTTGVWCLFALVFAIGSGIVTSRWIAQPIVKLRNASRAMANGELDQTIEAKGIDELSILAESFNQMATQLRSSFAALKQVNEELETRVEQRTAQLRESEERWQLAIEGTNDGIWDINFKTDEVFASPRMQEMLGYGDRTMPNSRQYWMSIIHPEDVDRTLEVIQAYLADRTLNYAVEHRLRCNNGTYIWVLSRGKVVRDEQGSPVRMVGSTTDISDRKQAEEALELIVEGTASTTGSEFFCSCVRYLAQVLNVRYAFVCAYRNQAGNRAQTLAFWHGEGWEENFEYDVAGTPCEQVLSTGKMCYYPSNVQDSFPNAPILVNLGLQSYLGVPLTNSTGNVLGLLAVLDVNPQPLARNPGKESILRIFAARAAAELERKLTQEALEEQAKLDSLLGQISRQFIDADIDAAILTALQAIGRYLHVDRSYIFQFSDDLSECINTHEWCAEGIAPFDEFGEGPRQASSWLYAQLLDGNTVKIACVASLPPEAASEKALLESKSIQSLAAVPMSYSGKLFGGIGLDAVEQRRMWSDRDIRLLKFVGEIIAIGLTRHKAELAQQRAKEAADAANLAKSQFLSKMSHELRTPLNAILGFSQVMVRDSSLKLEHREHLGIINRSGEHLLGLINDVLEMSKIEAGRITLDESSFDLYQMLNSLQEMLQIKAQAKGLQLTFERDASVPKYIQTDESKLRQVLINLLGNAIKFTQQGYVKLHVQVVHYSSLLLHDREQQMYNGQSIIPSTLLFEVSDTGSGIAQEEIESIFDPFVQSETGRKSHKGTGLGLAITRQFVQLMGGTITVNSTLGQGATFTFNIAVKIAASDEVPTVQPSRRVIGLQPNQPQYRILITEDVWENRQLLIKILSPLGFDVREAENGKEAVEIWESWQPHLIWMDMRMPVMDGYEATQQIKSHLKGQATVIIALTASAFDENQSVALSVGCDDFVRKPFREQVLFDKMAQYLGVRYIYEDENAGSDSSPLEKATPELTTEVLAAMPREWIEQLHQAATVGDAEVILQLSERLAESNGAIASVGTRSVVAQLLINWVNEFRFDLITNLTEPILN